MNNDKSQEDKKSKEEKVAFSRGGSLGLYVERNTLIHRLDPRSKFYLFVVILLTSALMIDELRLTGFIFIILFVLALLSRMSLKMYALLFGYTWVIFVANILIWPQYPQYRKGAVIFEMPIFGLVFTEYGLMAALSRFFLTVNPIVVMFILFTTTKPRDFAQGIMKLKLPYKFGYIFMLGLRFIPVITKEISEITEAQMSRGLELQRGNIINKLKNYIPIFVPMLIRMIKMSVQLGMSMESRAFGSKKTRTFLHEMKFALRDWLWFALWTAWFGFVLYLRLAYGLGTYPISLREGLLPPIIPYWPYIPYVSDFINWLLKALGFKLF